MVCNGWQEGGDSWMKSRHLFHPANPCFRGIFTISDLEVWMCCWISVHFHRCPSFGLADPWNLDKRRETQPPKEIDTKIYQNGLSKKNPKVMPLWSLGFFAAVLVGSVLSSFNSALNSAATIFGLEIYKVYINKDGIFPGKQQIKLNKRHVSTWTTLGPWKSGKIEHVLWKMNEFSLEKRPVQKEKVVFQPPFLGALLLFRGISEIDWDWMELFPWLWSKCGVKVDVSQTLHKGWVYRYVVHVGHGRIKDPTIGDIWEYTVWCSGAHTKM